MHLSMDSWTTARGADKIGRRAQFHFARFCGTVVIIAEGEAVTTRFLFCHSGRAAIAVAVRRYVCVDASESGCMGEWKDDYKLQPIEHYSS